MPTKKRNTAHKWVDPDEAPPLDRDWFERAEIREGDRVIRRAKIGRPKKDAPKEAVNIRLDPDVLAHFRAAIIGKLGHCDTSILRYAVPLSR